MIAGQVHHDATPSKLPSNSTNVNPPPGSDRLGTTAAAPGNSHTLPRAPPRSSLQQQQQQQPSAAVTASDYSTMRPAARAPVPGPSGPSSQTTHRQFAQQQSNSHPPDVYQTDYSAVSGAAAAESNKSPQTLVAPTSVNSPSVVPPKTPPCDISSPYGASTTANASTTHNSRRPSRRQPVIGPYVANSAGKQVSSRHSSLFIC